ncbi:MAG: cytochrome P450 [Actinomycetota bacterium]
MKLRRPEGRANPYPLLERVRRRAPVIFVPKHNWIVTRYAEASAVLRDPRFSSDQSTRHLRPGWDESWHEFTEKYPECPVRLTNTMMFKDGADHERLRGLVSKVFTPRVIGGLRDRVQALANELLDSAEARGHMDLIADYAYSLPVTIICELLGVPVEDRADFRQWTAQAARSLDPARNEEEADEMIRAGRDAAKKFGSYFTNIVQGRRSHPQDDLVTALINAQEGEDRLATDELLSTFVLLLVAGHETTTNLIGNGVLALLRNPAELETLRADLGSEPMRLAVEELLRYEPPVAGVVRIASDDVPFAGTVIPKGHDVIVLIAAANRDPAQFPDPDRLDIRRSDNRHLTFSGGPHFCLGAPLARLEGQIAIATLLRRFPSIELKTDEPEWRETFTLRALKQLPLSLTTS